MRYLQFVWVKTQVTKQDEPYTAIRHVWGLSVLTCRSPRNAVDGRQHSGNVVRCANWGRPTKWLFTRDRAFFPPLPYPSTDFIWRWGFLLIPFTAKSALVSVIDPVRINRSIAYSRLLIPQRSMLTKPEGHCLCSNTYTPRYPSGEACI